MQRFVTAFVALALLTGSAWGSAPSVHVSWTRAALSRVPVSKHDRTPERAEQHAQNLDAFAQEIARVSATAPLSPRQWASLLGAVGSVESNFDTDIVAGRCKPHQCDHGRAKGAFQNQNVGPVSDLWPTADGDIVAQVAMADRMLRRSVSRCAPFAPFPAHVFRAYRGGSCSWPVHRESERVAAYVRLMSTPAVKP
jgi:hypothetical protein